VGCLRIDEGANADADGGGSGREHRPGEYTAPTSMQGAALATEYGNPERHETQAAAKDMQHHKGVKQADDGFGHACHAADVTL